MKTVLQLVGFGLLVFVLGLLIGSSAAMSNKFLAGQLDACNKIAKLDPILAMAQVSCVAHDDNIALKVGEKLYSLDGKELN